MKIIKEFFKEFFFRCVVPTTLVFVAIVFAIAIATVLVNLVI